MGELDRYGARTICLDAMLRHRGLAPDDYPLIIQRLGYIPESLAFFESYEGLSGDFLNEQPKEQIREIYSGSVTCSRV